MTLVMIQAILERIMTPNRPRTRRFLRLEKMEGPECGN